MNRKDWAALALFALATAVAAAQEGGSPSPDAPWEDAESAVAKAERMRAHERMPDTMYASTPSEDKPYFAHPTPHATRPDDTAGRDDWRRAAASFQPLNTTGGETAEDVFRQSISEPVVQSKCVNCHVFGGISGQTRLVFAPASTTDHVSRNYRVFEDFVVSVPNAAALILDKIKGVAHGGGVQVPAGSALYADMQRFLNLLDSGAAAPVTAETLFDTVRMRPRRETLYRAAIILAGRIPTEAEYRALESATLLSIVRGLMTGQGFHDFLIRAANDRLLTDGATPNLSQRFVNNRNERNRLWQAMHDEIDGSRRAYYHYDYGVDFGVRRAPLELIAHVVENDLPYTNILTADYIMANPQAALAYGARDAREEFGGSDDVHDFRPSLIEGYYPSGSVECEDGRCSVDGPPLAHPYAGILGTRALLYRYPTTPTNRNRARARWTYYHFLGVDVEGLGVRTLDPNSLVDEGNPTMNNPACTSCHAILDPVAGTFQHYDEFGLYKSSDGEDSLPSRYKFEQWRPLGSRALSDEPSTVTFRGWLPDLEGEEQGIYFEHADAIEGEWLYFREIVVFDASGRQVYKMDADSYPWRGGGCYPYKENSHVALPWNCVLIITPHLDEGEYSFELTAWAKTEGTRVEATSVFRLWRPGDTWFRDMRRPGFNGAIAPETTDSLEWLGRRIAEDHRFAEATVKFWWPAIMGGEVARPPTDRSDADFESRFLEAQAQGLEVERLARLFRNGRGGDRPYNVKDLLAELVLSRWFRAQRITDENQVRRAALRSAGASRPLTPEELVAKTEALTGYVWGRKRKTYGPERDRPQGILQETYAPLYGGIDSEDVTERSRQFTAPAAQVAKLHANRVATLVVIREFYLLPQRERRLLLGVGPSDTPETAPDGIKEKLAELQEMFFGVPAREKDVRIAYRFFEDVWRSVSRTNRGFYDIWECSVYSEELDHCYLKGIRDDALVAESLYFSWASGWRGELAYDIIDTLETPYEEARMVMAWSTVLAAMLMDYRYLHL